MTDDELDTAKTDGGTVRRYLPAGIVDGRGEYHPEFKGSNIFGLQRVHLDDGEHLLGTVSKFAKIVDFSTGDVVYDFSDFGGRPRAGGDSHGAVCEWRGRYYFGGWVVCPSPTDSFDVENKYSYVLELDPSKNRPFENWEVILSDRCGDHGLTGDGDGWVAEVQYLVPTPTGVYVCRGSDGGSGVNTGVYKYDGDTARNLTRVVPEKATAATLVGDEMWVYVGESTGYEVIDITDDTVRTVPVTSVPRRTGGTQTLRGTTDCLADVNGTVVHPRTNGIAFHDGNGTGAFVPFSIRNVYRTGGYSAARRPTRCDVLPVKGGLLIPWNDLSKSSGTAISDPVTWNQSWLTFLTQSDVRLVDTAKWIGGVELVGDRIYYGTSPGGHGSSGTFAATASDRPSLASIEVADLRDPSKQPPVRDRLDYRNFADGDPESTGVETTLGGYPVLGYGKITFDVTITGLSSSLDVELREWGLHDDHRVLRTVTFDDGDRHRITATDADHTGGIVGICLRTHGDDVDASVSGSVHLQ